MNKEICMKCITETNKIKRFRKRQLRKKLAKGRSVCWCNPFMGQECPYKLEQLVLG